MPRYVLCGLRISLLAVVGILPGLQVAAQDDGPKWNPFAKSAEPTSEVRNSSFFDGGQSKSPFQLPKWTLPTFGSKKPKTSATTASSQTSADKAATTRTTPADGPSTMDRFSMSTKKFTNSTKKMWDDTVDFMNPFSSEKSTASKKQQGYQPQNATDKKESGGIFSWLTPVEEPGEPQDVNSFLRQPRPRF